MPVELCTIKTTVSVQVLVRFQANWGARSENVIWANYRFNRWIQYTLSLGQQASRCLFLLFYMCRGSWARWTFAAGYFLTRSQPVMKRPVHQRARSTGISGFLTGRTARSRYSPVSQAPVTFVYKCATCQESKWMTQRGTFIKVNFPETKAAVGVMTGSITAALTFLLQLSSRPADQTCANAWLICG